MDRTMTAFFSLSPIGLLAVRLFVVALGVLRFVVGFSATSSRKDSIVGAV